MDLLALDRKEAALFQSLLVRKDPSALVTLSKINLARECIQVCIEAIGRVAEAVNRNTRKELKDHERQSQKKHRIRHERHRIDITKEICAQEALAQELRHQIKV